MFEKINKEAKNLFEKHPELKNGRKASIQEYKSLKWRIRRKIPKWFVSFMQLYPVSNLSIGIPFNYGWESLKSLSIEELPFLNTSFNSFEDIEYEATESFPGFELIKKGFICIANDENLGGNGFYINSKDKNPKVIYVYHDCGTSAKELIENSQTIANSFTHFISIIKTPQNIDEWLSKNPKT